MRLGPEVEAHSETKLVIVLDSKQAKRLGLSGHQALALGLITICATVIQVIRWSTCGFNFL